MHSASRTNFLERVRILSNALSEGILIDQPPSSIEHNERARFLRNGLAIIAFNILEDYIKYRVDEFFSILSSTTVPFNHLPEKVQDIALLHSLKGIHTLALRKKKATEDYKGFIQTEVNKSASTLGSPYSMSSFGFGWDKSNLDYDDIADILKSFQVEGNSAAIGQLTSLIGCPILVPKDFFNNAASRRHTAAHNPNATSSLIDLQDYIVSVKAFALSIDLLICTAIKKIENGTMTIATKIRYNDVKIRYVHKIGSDFSERSQNNSSVLKVHSSESDAITSIQGRRNYQGEMIVILDVPSKVYNWFTAF